MNRLWALAAAALWLCLPLLPIPTFWITLANYAGIAAIVALGLCVLTGFAGMTSFAQATFMGFGAYTSAVLTTAAGWSPWLALPAALAVSAAAALLIGAITLRLSGHYLALGTIAWSVSFYYIFANLDLFGRNDGISAIPPLTLGAHPLISSQSYFPVVTAALALALLATANLLDSRPGRAIRALGGGQSGGAAAAASFGVSLPATRMLAFTYAATLAGLAGWLYAHMQRSVNPTPFGLNASIEYLLMAVIGGPAALPGALLGAGLVTVLNDQLQDWLPRLLGESGSFETIVFGIALVLILQLAPAGLWPLLRRRNQPAKPVRPRRPAPELPRRPLPTPGTPLLAADSLTKTFGGLVAVNHLSFRIDAGEIVALIGPNGAGKSTTFDLLTGAARPTAGRLTLRGQTLARTTPQRVARLGIARSFQHVKLVPGMSVLENVALGAHLRGRATPLAALFRLDRREEAALLAEAAHQLDRTGLAADAARPAGSLALGGQRIVEIARALCLDPALLLLDEPAAGLRLPEKQALATLLRRLRAEGVTVLLVEHDMDFVMGLADRLIVMEFGAKLADGPAPAIRADPRVVEAYLGAEL